MSVQAPRRCRILIEAFLALAYAGTGGLHKLDLLICDNETLRELYK